jgi:hypothetical protein
MREGKSRVTRSSLEGKPELVKYFSPLVVKRYGEYMLKHQTQEDGKPRAGDNWRQGWNEEWWNDSLIDSKMRHFLDEWLIHDGYPEEARDDEEEALCAEMFGSMARLHNILHKKYEERNR